jgi:hypothetical protein
MAASAVSVALGTGKEGDKFAVFSPEGISPGLFRRVLAPYGLRFKKDRIEKYAVPLEAALRACAAVQKRGVALRAAQKDTPGIIKAASWKCVAKDLYPYQRVGAEFLRSRRRALLADQMGTGKSPQSLIAIDARRGTLVIAPPVVVGNWFKEARRWRPDLTARVWRDPYPLFPDPGELNIVPYSQLPRDRIERRSRCPWCRQASVVPLEDEEVFVLSAQQKPWTDKCDPERGGKCAGADKVPRVRRFQQRKDAWPEWVWTGAMPKHPVQLIVDEAHYCKTKDSQRTIAVRVIASACATGVAGNKSAIWLLTGTPLLNAPPELWSLCQLFPGQGGEFDDGAWDTFGSWSAFVEMFGGRKNAPVRGVSRGFEWKPGFASAEARECLSSVMLRRLREDVLPDLPKKTRRYIDVAIDEKKLSKLVTLTENLLLLFREWSDEQVLEECAAGGALSTIRKELAALKADTLTSLVKEYEEVDEPVIAFSYHRDPIIALGARKGWVCITGSTSDVERTVIVERFQKGELRGIAGTIGAMGVGVTLTRAANVLFLDRDFVPANNLQAEDRCVRIGQTRGVVVSILNALHPVDERVAIILDRKEKLLEAMNLAEERNPVLDGNANGPLFKEARQ